MDQATGEVQYYQFNGHGDVVGLTDSQGKQLNTYTYDIWGNPETTEETVPNVFRYSGEYWDNTTDLQYLRARWYDPNAGRFVSKDPYQGSISNPLSLNRYSYVENNPLVYTDPSGNKPYAVKSNGEYYIYYTGKLDQSVRDTYGFIPWVGGFLLDGIDSALGIHDFDSDDVNGAKKIFNISNYESLALDIASKVGDNYASKAKKFKSTAKVFSKIAGVVGYAATIEDLLQTNFGYKNYKVDKFINFQFGDVLVAKSTDELLAKYLYTRLRLLELMDQGEIKYINEKKVKGWTWNNEAIETLKSEIKQIKKPKK